MIQARKLIAEFAGTALLVFFGVGVATLSFGRGFGATGSSVSAGIVATALAFGLVLLVLVYAIGPVTGCHVNPAVTIAFMATRRQELAEGAAYWIAQVLGGIFGSLVLWGVFQGSPLYRTKVTGLGADGFGANSMVRLDATGAFLAEVVLTLLFVFVVLAVTSRTEHRAAAGAAIGLALTTVHLVGIALTGTSVNPARSIGPALFAGGSYLSQLWLFIVAPLVGGLLAGGLFLGLVAPSNRKAEAAGRVEIEYTEVTELDEG